MTGNGLHRICWKTCQALVNNLQTIPTMPWIPASLVRCLALQCDQTSRHPGAMHHKRQNHAMAMRALNRGVLARYLVDHFSSFLHLTLKQLKKCQHSKQNRVAPKSAALSFNPWDILRYCLLIFAFVCYVWAHTSGSDDGRRDPGKKQLSDPMSPMLHHIWPVFTGRNLRRLLSVDGNSTIFPTQIIYPVIN